MSEQTPVSKQMSVAGSDLVLIAAGVLLVWIVSESFYYLHFAPSSWKDTYDDVVKGTLVPLFTTVVGIKVTYTAVAFTLNKFRDK